MNPPSSLFERLVARRRRAWVMLGIAALLFAAPFLAASADHVLRKLLSGAGWQGLLVPPAVITYILLVAPRMAGMEDTVLRAIRPAVLLDDDQFARLAQGATASTPRQEALIFGAGALVGLLISAGDSVVGFSWLGLAWLLSISLMYGLLAWAVFGSVLDTRLITALLRQRLRIDPFDTAPFEPMGRHSLLLAMVFVGGITLSLPFVVLQPGALRQPIVWLIYVPLVAIPVVIFFLGMSPVHRVLAAARDREREAVQQQFLRLSRELLQRLEGQQETGNLAAEINALAVYDERLQMVPTWPYNTGMLRTLIFSVFIPAATILGKIVVDVLF